MKSEKCELKRRWLTEPSAQKPGRNLRFSFCNFHFLISNCQSHLRTSQLRHRLHPRAGLAPLELTLVLPTLLCLMALMINFGVAGAWKVRTQVAARYAGWGTVAERTGEFNPLPENWPANALLEEANGTNLPVLDQLWNSQTELLAPAVRGPMLTSPQQEIPVPVKRRLEMDDEVQRGHAVLDRPLPLLRGATATGRFGYDLNQDLFDNRWQFFTMGFADNEDLRTDLWYAISHNELAQVDREIAQQWDLLQRAALELRNNPNKCALYALDRDREFQTYYGSAPDFYPRVRGCSLDVDDVSMRLVGPLISEIDRLPVTISLRFSAMYRSWICGLEMCGSPEFGPLLAKYNGLRPLSGLRQLRPCVCMSATPCPCPPLPGPDNCD